MNHILHFIAIITILILSSCNTPSSAAKYLETNSITNDTVYVTRDKPEIYRFAVESNPGVDSRFIEPQMYHGSELVHVKSISTAVVAHATYITNGTVDITIYASPECTPSTYTMKISVTNSGLVSFENVTVIVQ